MKEVEACQRIYVDKNIYENCARRVREGQTCRESLVRYALRMRALFLTNMGNEHSLNTETANESSQTDLCFSANWASSKFSLPGTSGVAAVAVTGATGNGAAGVALTADRQRYI